MVLRKAHAHGGNIQAIVAPDGVPLWAWPAEPGSVHDFTAARAHALPALYPAAAAGLPALPGPGIRRSRDRHPHPGAPAARRPGPGINTRARNALQRSLRCLGERGFALLTGRWRALQHVTVSPGKTGGIARAALVRTHVEHGYIT